MEELARTHPGAKGRPRRSADLKVGASLLFILVPSGAKLLKQLKLVARMFTTGLNRLCENFFVDF